ncbi:hypothetical protein V493_03694 [Pseudogymnoascus sp. VKM F-4281 (FW-2241)]|nr:hypothetical protein V493_03694 [Pseudogymnoascus sp. VKM F-4281 (FW-2241)]
MRLKIHSDTGWVDWVGDGDGDGGYIQCASGAVLDCDSGVDSGHITNQPTTRLFVCLHTVAAATAVHPPGRSRSSRLAVAWCLVQPTLALPLPGSGSVVYSSWWLAGWLERGVGDAAAATVLAIDICWRRVIRASTDAQAGMSTLHPVLHSVGRIDHQDDHKLIILAATTYYDRTIIVLWYGTLPEKKVKKERGGDSHVLTSDAVFTSTTRTLPPADEIFPSRARG